MGKTIGLRINLSNLPIIGMYVLTCQALQVARITSGFFLQVDLTRIVRSSMTNFNYRSQMEPVDRQESINGKNRFCLAFGIRWQVEDI